MSLHTVLNIVQVIVSAALILAILFQVRGGGLGGIFGNPETTGFRTRRGFEKTLFQFTIAMTVIFVIIAILSLRAA